MRRKARTTRVLRAENARLRQRISQLQEELQVQKVEKQKFTRLADSYATTQIQTEEDIRVSEEKFRAFVEQSWDGIILTDDQGSIIEWNHSIEQIMGLSREEALGRPIWDVLFQVTPEECRTPAAYKQLKTQTLVFLQTGEAPWGRTVLERTARRPDGAERHVQSMIFPIQTAHGLLSAGITRDITERKRTEEAYRTVVEQSLQGLSIFQNGRIVFTNPATAQITGYSPEELLAMTSAEVQALTHPDDRPMVTARGRNRIAGKDEPSRYEFRILHKDGTVRWVEVFSVRIAYRSRTAVQMTYIDITERKQAEEQIRFQAQLLNEVGQAIVVSRVDGTITNWNRTAEQLYGWPAAEVIGRDVLNILPSEEWITQASEIMNQVRAGQSWSGEFQVRRRDGTPFYVLATDVPIYDEHGELSALINISTDISARKRMEEALRESEERYRAVSSLTSDFAFALRVDPDGSVMLEWVAGATTRILGLTTDEMNDPAKMMGTVHPDDLPRMVEHHRRILTGQTTGALEFRIVRHGEIRWLNNHSRPIWDATHKRVVRIYGAVQDITERKEIEAAFRASEEHYARATNAGKVNVWDWDLRTNAIYVSDMLKQLLGYGHDVQWDIINAWEQLVHPEDLARLVALREGIYRGEVDEDTAEYRMRHRDGSFRWFLSRYQVIRDAVGTPIMLSGTDTDITELKELETALQQRVRELEVLHTLMNEITGELNLETLLGDILKWSVILLDANSGQLALYDAERHELQILAGYNMHDEFTGNRQSVTPGGTEQVLLTRRPLVIENYPAWVGRLPQYRINAKTLLLVPLLAGEQVVGIIIIGDDRPERTFTAADTELLTLFAQQATIAIRNAQIFAEARHLATIDALTDLCNRRAFFELAQHEFERSRRYGHLLSLLMLDIDHFKQINDTYGHAAGDQVLRTVAYECRALLRTLDIIGRYGGEEVIMALPETNEENAQQVAERLRQHLAQTVISADAHAVQISVSLGVATANDVEELTLEALINRADQALYAAKQAGRNRVVVWSAANANGKI
jgi:diguanylate cyclase (GGDEF)-like protein/PAS domain S-box-containing protein